MKRIQLEIKVLSPLAIGRQKPGGSVIEAEDYIPGSAIRGAMACQILQEYRQQERNQQTDDLIEDFSSAGGEFQALFMNESQAIFQNAYPATVEIDDETVVLETVKVLPATALSSKTKPSFTTSKGGKGVFDTLFDRFCADWYDRLYDPNCPTDGGRVDSPDISFYSNFNDDYYSPTASKRLLTRVGINRRRATAEEQILYSIEVLNESQANKKKPVIYRGAILVPDAQLADSLRQYIQNRSEDFRLGGSISRGLGKVKITAKPPVDARRKLKPRIEDFNKKLRKRWDAWKIFGDAPKQLPDNRIYFSLDLQSDAILTESWRRTTVISEAMLQQFTGIEDSSLKLEVAYSSYDYRSGWNAAWGLMKDVELITNKGAVYLFSTTPQPDIWFEKLEELEMKGVGDRTSEGFGQVQICNEFHLVFREDAV